MFELFMESLGNLYGRRSILAIERRVFARPLRLLIAKASPLLQHDVGSNLDYIPRRRVVDGSSVTEPRVQFNVLVVDDQPALRKVFRTSRQPAALWSRRRAAEKKLSTSCPAALLI